MNSPRTIECATAIMNGTFRKATEHGYDGSDKVIAVSVVDGKIVDVFMECDMPPNE